MIYLFTVAAPSRSDTLWYSRLFTTEHSYCYHELTNLLHPYPTAAAIWQSGWVLEQLADHDFEQAQRRRLLQCYPNYFARLWERANFGQYVVGNSDASTIDFLPALWLLWPTMKFILPKGNGIESVQSHFAHRAHLPPDVVARLATNSGRSDFFSACCRIWTRQVDRLDRSKQWLHGRAEYLETSLEKFTTDLEGVRRVWNWFGFGKWGENEDRIRRMMRPPMNSRTDTGHVAGPEAIWQSWTEDQRAIFRMICGDTQQRLGFSLPDSR